jgi:hypothetical protein
MRYLYLGVKSVSKYKVDTLNVMFDGMVDLDGHEVHSRTVRGGKKLWPGEEMLVHIAAMNMEGPEKAIIVNGGEYDRPPYFIHFSATTADHKTQTTCKVYIDQDGLLQAELVYHPGQRWSMREVRSR